MFENKECVMKEIQTLFGILSPLSSLLSPLKMQKKEASFGILSPLSSLLSPLKITISLSTLLSPLFLLTSCSLFDFHPYDADISGEGDLNNKNIALIESACRDKDTLRVAYTGDTQGWLDDTEDMVEDINGRGNIDFLVHGGDLTDFGLTKEFEWQRDVLKKLECPYVVIIGNHDCLGTGKSCFNNLFGEENFSFIAGRIKFVCLNTNALEYDYSHPIPNFEYIEQEQTADSTLFDRTIVSMHAGPYSDEFNNNVAKPFHYEMTKFKGLLFCTMAHDHHFAEKNLFEDGIMYYTTDCAKERRYLLFTITPDGYSYELISF